MNYLKLMPIIVVIFTAPLLYSYNFRAKHELKPGPSWHGKGLVSSQKLTKKDEKYIKMITSSGNGKYITNGITSDQKIKWLLVSSVYSLDMIYCRLKYTLVGFSSFKSGQLLFTSHNIADANNLMNFSLASNLNFYAFSNSTGAFLQYVYKHKNGFYYCAGALIKLPSMHNTDLCSKIYINPECQHVTLSFNNGMQEVFSVKQIDKTIVQS